MKYFVVMGTCLVFLLCGCSNSYVKASFPPETSWQTVAYTPPRQRLERDMTQEEVVQLMGSPDKRITIYFCYKKDQGGIFSRLSKKNYTPLVFVDNKLAGWGWNYLNGAAKDITND